MYKVKINQEKNTYSAIVNDFNYIVHHGIKGQKWGVRRFQNQDGSYTPAGKERYNHGNSDGSTNGSKGTSSGSGKSSTGGKTVKTALKSSENKLHFTDKTTKETLNKVVSDSVDKMWKKEYSKIDKLYDDRDDYMDSRVKKELGYSSFEEARKAAVEQNDLIDRVKIIWSKINAIEDEARDKYNPEIEKANKLLREKRTEIETNYLKDYMKAKNVKIIDIDSSFGGTWIDLMDADNKDASKYGLEAGFLSKDGQFTTDWENYNGGVSAYRLKE